MQADHAAHFEAANAVFEGRVTRIQQGEPLEVTLMVVRTWKGADSEEVVVQTPSNSAACGVSFEQDHSYLVYATTEGEELFASLCGGTARVEDSQEALDQLGAGVTPVDPEPANELRENDESEDDQAATVPPSSGGCASCAIGANDTPGSLTLGGLFVFAIALYLRRRQLL